MFGGVATPREALLPRTDDGAKGLRCHVSGHAEERVPLGACTSCSKREAHGPPTSQIRWTVPVGAGRADGVAAAAVPDATQLARVWSALWVLHYVANGLPIGAVPPMGLGNPTVAVRYRVTAASGNLLTVDSGPDPRRVVIEEQIANPGGGGTIAVERRAAITPGAEVRILAPSALASKCRPMVLRVWPPTGALANGASWQIEVGADVSNLRTPDDEALVGATYQIDVHMEMLAPPAMPNWQASQETHWVRRRRTLTRAQIVSAGGLVALTRSDGTAGRVLWPDMLPGAMAIDAATASGGLTTEVPLAGDVVQTGTGPWATWLDVSRWMSEDLAWVRVSYYAEALPGDVGTVVFAGSCSNSQVDRSGSYVHHGGRRCTNVACSAFAAGAYRAVCWQPGASGFCLGTTAAAYRGGNMVAGPADARDASWWRRFWHRGSWVRVQAAAGLPQYSLERPADGGPSVSELLGAFSDSVPAGVFARRELFFGPAMGRRVTSVPPGGGTLQGLQTGAFVAAVAQTWGASKVAGSLPAEVAGWATRSDPTGSAMVQGRALMPAERVGGMHSHTHAAIGEGARTNVGRITRQLYVVGVSGDAVDASLDAQISGRFATW